MVNNEGKHGQWNMRNMKQNQPQRSALSTTTTNTRNTPHPHAGNIVTVIYNDQSFEINLPMDFDSEEFTGYDGMFGSCIR